MQPILIKTDYLLYRECPKNVWYKIQRPEWYAKSELTEFEKSIMETGNEVEKIARKLFPDGMLVAYRDERGQAETEKLLAENKNVIFQPVFVRNNFLAALDILQREKNGKGYNVYEIKSTSDVDKKTHFHDLAFQVNVLRMTGLEINKSFVIHLNSEYIRNGAIQLDQLFKVTDVTDEVESLLPDVATEAEEALKYITQTSEPEGCCCCIYKGRSKHCSTFQLANPDVPEYSVHDISRIGVSKAKLKELIDGNIFHLDKIPAHIKLSEIQQGQVETYKLNKVLVAKDRIAEEFSGLTFPLYFLDYETFPSAIPRYDGFSPYKQIPFQYSVYKLDSAESEPTHFDFLYSGPEDPSKHFAESLREHIGDKGSIIVWHKDFECGRNNEIGSRIPTTKAFFDSVNQRVYDLEDIFKKQYHVHRDYKGSTSIKNVLPVLVPELTYKDLEIRDGGSAADSWDKIISGVYNETEKEKVIKDLKIYCGLDTFAMYAIWNCLNKLL